MGHVLRFVLLACACACACACSHSGHGPSSNGPSCDSQDGNQSGSQLKVAWLASDDGTCVVAGVFDSKNHGTCAPAPWSDGTSYCTFEGVADALFMGNNCMNLLDGTGTSQGSAFTPVVARDAQGRITDEWTAGTHSVNITVKDAVSTRDATGACNVVADCNFENCYGIPFTHSSGGTHVAQSALVQASTSAFGRDRYQPLFTQGADGLQAQVSTEAFDSMLGVECVPKTFSDKTVCEPIQISDVVTFSDAGCTQGLVWEPTGVTPSSGLLRQSMACASDAPRYVKPAGRVTALASVYSRDASGACMESQATAGDYYTLTDVDLSVARAPDADPTHRLQIIHLANEPQWRDTVLYDTELGTECAVSTAHDGAVRCLPTSTLQAQANSPDQAESFYTDATCTHLVAVAVGFPAPGCGPITGMRYALDRSNAVWSVGSASRWQDLYFSGSNTCLPVCNIGGSGCPDGQPYLLTGALDDAQFAQLVPSAE